MGKAESKERVFDESVELADNAMLKKMPHLFDEWDFEKNDELGLDVYKITKGVRTMVWWTCPTCGSGYDTSANNKTHGRGCPYCSGTKVNHTNSLAALKPDIAKEWHPTLNGELTAHDVTCGKTAKTWWICELGHEWEAGIAHRSNGTGCPYCSGHMAWRGFNDMWTTNPELAKQLANPEDGYMHTQGSDTKLDWKCSECKSIIKHKRIGGVNSQGLCCPKCSDGVSFGEKFLYSILNRHSINFSFDSTQEWSEGKRYDFYLPDHKCIIEVHGAQHYKDFARKSGRTFKEEQENDKLKEKLAKENDIDKYIVIDARESTVEWMKNSILSSDIMKIVSDIDFEQIGQLASDSFIKAACDLWNSGIQSTLGIAEIMKISKTTALNYLKRGAEIGWCNYCPKMIRRETSRLVGMRSGIRVVQLEIEGGYVCEWNSMTDAARALNISSVVISRVCKGKGKTAGGFKWMYKEDYDEYVAKCLKNQKELSSNIR